MFDHRRFSIISSDDINLINFNDVLETSIDTVRYSADGTKTFVKYDCTCDHDSESCECCPTSITNCPSYSGVLTLSEIQAVLATPEWMPGM
tara:strand:+ start:3799 stop:4071 length:273 start_codon:yes stop_codon:yes gene_type:complete